jgi:pimeloyl-ACP methyl ester carboxylesterase
VNLFFRTFGEGQPVIILHGLFGISDNWVTFGKKLAEQGYQVYIPDQRNHGQSPHSDVFNYLALTDDLYEFIEEHKIELPILIGHSMGGKVTSRFALENPELLKKVIVVDISLRAYTNRSHHAKIIDGMRRIKFDMVSSRKEVDMLLTERIPDFRIRQFILKNLYWKEKDKLAWRINFEAICDNLENIFDDIDTIDRFNKPALFIKGGLSDYILPEDFPVIEYNFPQSKIITIENTSHWLHAEAPKEFAKLVFDFVKEED